MSRSLDAYMYDQFLNCLIRATSISKRIVALQAKEAMIKFLQLANYYPKTPQLFWLAMNEKNNQVRHFVTLYVKAMLHAHAPKEQVRHSMDRSGGTDLIGKILEKGLTDATPIVRETCREPFWFFWYFWQERGDALLRHLPASILKPLEKSKSASLAALSAAPMADIVTTSPSNSTNSHSQHHPVSPSSSNTSFGSLESASTKQRHLVANSSNSSSNNFSTSTATGLHKRSMSPSLLRSTSPLIFRHAGHQPSVASATVLPHTASNQGSLPGSSNNSIASTVSSLRKSRVPGLSRKKSMLSVKRKQSILAMLQQDDLATRVEGLQALSRKLTPYSDYPVDIATIQVDAGGGANALMVDGATFQSVLLTLFTSTLEQNNGNPKLYEALSSWDSVLGVMLKLIPFDEYLPKIMLDCAVEQQQPQQGSPQQKQDDEWIKYASASRAWARTKWYLKRHDPDLAEKIYNGLMMLDGSNSGTSTYQPSPATVKKKTTMRPMERRKLTKQWLVWMDELVLSVIGLDNEDGTDVGEDDAWLSEAGEDPSLLRHGLGRTYWQDLFGNEPNAKNVASAWFESDANVRQCLQLLLPLLLSSSPGSLWHEPLVTLVGHIRLINQKLFDMLVTTLDDPSAAKISRILGIHLRVVFAPPLSQTVQQPVTPSSTYPQSLTATEMMVTSTPADEYEESTEESKQDLSVGERSDDNMSVNQQSPVSVEKEISCRVEQQPENENPHDLAHPTLSEVVNHSNIDDNGPDTIDLTPIDNGAEDEVPSNPLPLTPDRHTVTHASKEQPTQHINEAAEEKSPLTADRIPSPVSSAIGGLK